MHSPERLSFLCAAQAMSGRDNGLPPKEAALFKSIVKHYETKQYKKGLKAADAVLKKYPEHGETLAMKGLILNCQERKAEAYELVRLGVKKDLRATSACLRIALSLRPRLQAIKCYRGARGGRQRADSARPVAASGADAGPVWLRRHRQHLLTLKPTNRNNWFTFAVSQHLQGQLEGAIGTSSVRGSSKAPSSMSTRRCCSTRI